MFAKRCSLTVAALLVPIASVVLDFILFYAYLRLNTSIIENRDRSLFSISVILCILCGIIFIAAEVLTWVLLNRSGTLDKRKLHIALLIGAVVYVLVIMFIFPKSLDILYTYLPKSELAPGLFLLFFQLSAYAAAALCGIVNSIGLYKKI